MSYYYSNGSGRGGFLSDLPPATKNIIIINGFFLIMMYLKPDLMTEKFALFYPSSRYFHFWQYISYMFMHGGFMHFFFNMWSLYMFGRVLERVWGTRKFLIFYFVTGLGAAAVHTGVSAIQAQHLMTQIAENVPGAVTAYSRLLATPTVGASGAIYGILMGFAMLYPDSVLTLIFPPISLKAKWFVLIFAAIELFTGVTGTAEGVAHFAHLGGMIFGYILILIWKKQHRLYQYE
ncbi:MAG: rhomboid family intramembrane serine protease [Bacteroidales bacterium]|nr:rhomboid family intramembrane serine protease [Candidatus Cryptobacteroides caccocaballi]